MMSRYSSSDCFRSHDKLFDNNFNFMKNVPPPNINTSKLPNQAMFIPNREKVITYILIVINVSKLSLIIFLQYPIQQANLPPSQFPWSNTKPLSANVVSLDEIQAEEQFQLSKVFFFRQFFKLDFHTIRWNCFSPKYWVQIITDINFYFQLEKSASTSRIFHSRNQKMWNNSSENTNFTTEGN